MPGFIVSSCPGSTDVSISASGVERVTTDRGNTALVDGYALGVSTQRLVTALEAHDDEFLSTVHGNYCALLISPDGEMEGFCDRFGARTLYWRDSNSAGVIVSSRWETMPVCERRFDGAGLAEALHYRWTSGQRTQIAGVSRLPHWQRVRFLRGGGVSTTDTAQALDWPGNLPVSSFAEKLEETRLALGETLAEVAESFDSTAIFLSGGVDSSLLSALSKSRFRNCLLVTPVFSGDYSGELDAAKTFAQVLGLKHLLVKIDEERILNDLRELVGARGGQVFFHSLAIHQMMDAIPDEYPLVIYGEGADTLFGSKVFAVTRNFLRRKNFVSLLPDFALRLSTRLPSQRVRRQGRLLQRPATDIALWPLQIPYPDEAMAIVRDLCEASIDDIYAHQAVSQFLANRNGGFRNLMQDIAFRTDSASHFSETGLSAARLGKKVFMPFMAQPVIEAARNLSDEQYFGGEHVKPIVRALAAEHFERELIYAPKRGFDVPAVRWLKGALAPRVDEVRQETELFDGHRLKDLDVDRHYSLYWTLICWQLLNEQLAENETRTF